MNRIVEAAITPDSFVIPVSDNRAYKQFGNSVVVPLIQAVASQVIKVILNEQNC